MDYQEIKNIISDMENANFEELNIEFPDGVKINMKKNTSPVAVATTNHTNENVATSNEQAMFIQTINETTEKREADNCKLINSPMVGTFYNSASPEEKPFVNVGDRVKKGQVLCIIEAMKLMNEIESEYDGEVVEVCMNNEDVVEYGSTLFKIRGDK